MFLLHGVDSFQNYYYAENTTDATSQNILMPDVDKLGMEDVCEYEQSIRSVRRDSCKLNQTTYLSLIQNIKT